VSRTRPDPTTTVDLTDAFDLAVEEVTSVAPPVPAPTGLSDEEDALRHMALRFNQTIEWCNNCECAYDTHTDSGLLQACPRCDDWLDKANNPRRRKHT